MVLVEFDDKNDSCLNIELSGGRVCVSPWLLATRLGVDEHAPPKEIAAALWSGLRGRGRGGGSGGRKGGLTAAPEESSA